ncbi:acyl-CoA dehydrogenase family protein [Conexibacter woesei]|uniref:Acyl-CoA dehydrogenase domain protein n=1 Tax=Conexibacter woesei (strain DSM 14684 / CCUG 47730 / CIP 108061 / JCM 11494 / NBRC 100937 / ID131577) TaxID=469383 RepID=D3F6J5_CONWI|nr:acyl-CoA dehydrogenase family protein [Conexibacter woesei]ADB50762.1 acyl-CoA dehydrogenase domain protein [Conexibacter woesei DSM 14684]
MSALADVLLGAPELELRERVRAVARADVAPRAADVDRDARFPHESYQALARAGLAGLLVPPALGGSGGSVLGYVVAMEEIAAACPATATVYMTQMHAANPILMAGSDEQRRRWLPLLCDGSAYGSLAVSEPEAGSDVAALRTFARRDGEDGYVLDGAKTFITTGDRADVVVLFATVDRTAGRDGITAFLIERGTPGLVAGPAMHKLGMRGSSTVELFLDGVRAPVAARLGSERGGWALSMRSVVKSRLSAAAQGVGIARGAYEHARTWAHERGLLRGSRGVAQDAQFALAEADARIAAMRALLQQTAALVDRADGAEPVAQVSAAKLVCTDGAMAICDELVDLLGPDGDDERHGVERYLRDAKVTQIYDGTNQIQRLLIARDVRADAEAAA